MTERHHRHLPLSAAATKGVSKSLAASKPPEMTWRDYLVMLLHLGAEIEHALMVEYLYAAYSLGGDQVPEKHRAKVQSWQDQILTVAREEMGHLLTLQNVLCLLGAPVSFERQDYPWDSPFYPFEFKLAPLSMHTLSHYVYAESPPPEDLPKKMPPEDRRIYEKVRKSVEAERGTVHHVGEIYDFILELLENADLIPDSDFQSATYDSQASWDEWGRGYQPDPRQPDPDPTAEGRPAPPPRPWVIVAQMATRTEVLEALRQVAGQGEAPHKQDSSVDEPSHFDRFAHVYEGYERISRWQPTRRVATNPTTFEPGGVRGTSSWTYIENDTSRQWAHLFNLRYRMLLTYLSHSYRMQRSGEWSSLRAGTLHRVFGEMYNIKTVAGILMRMPLLSNERDPRRAGPPFQMPYNLTLPPGEADCWRIHQDLLMSSLGLCNELIGKAPPDGVGYLEGLMHLDTESLEWTNQVLVGLGAGARRISV